MNKFINFFKNNLLIISTILLAIFIELWGVTYTSCFPLLLRPLYPTLILIFILLVGTLFKKKSLTLTFYTTMFLVQLFVNTGFIFLFDSNGTVFEWAMFNQRTDAVGSLETLELQFGYVFICLTLIIGYVLLNSFQIKKNKVNKTYNLKRKIITLSSILLLIITIPYANTLININKDYDTKLYDTKHNSYQYIGMVGNTVYHLIRGNDSANVDNLDKIEENIYQDYIYTSKYNGISKNNNLVLILVESMEWYPFDLFPEYSHILYPNLTQFFDNSIVGENFHQKEKTDVSEALAVLGNYPTGQYVNYDFYENAYPYSLPSLIKSNNENTKVNSFHNNYGNFYNRYAIHKSWGFDKFYAIEDMKEFGVVDTWQDRGGDRNLDSITFDKMKEVMFPTDEKFFSYILSFTTHGYYGDRENLNEYYKTIDELELFKGKDATIDRYLRTYMAALMDFDKAVGTMMNYLEENNLKDNTTIVLFADHNSYYNNLSNHAKKVEDKYNPEIYRIPFAIYDTKLFNEYTKDNNSNTITKFTTTSDIVPTVLDIFGINGWKNLYFGNSVFVEDIESIVYSRTYGFFVDDNFVGYSLNRPISKNKLTKDEFKDIEQRALTHVKKLEYIDKIYYSNYFKQNPYHSTKD